MGVTCGLTRMPDNPEIWKAVAMADQFDKMQKLPDPLPGCPNFHRIPGYKVYTCGQPTLDGIKNVLEKVTGTIYPKDGPIIWLNLRQEPDVMSTASQFARGLQTRLENMPSLELSPVTSSRPMRLSSSRWLRAAEGERRQAEVCHHQ